MNLLKGLRGVLVAVLALSVFTNLLLFSVPLYMLQIYDRVLLSRSTETLMLLTLVVLGLLGALALLEWLRAQILARCGESLDERYSRAIVRRTLDGDAPASLLQEARRLRDFLATPSAAAMFDVPMAPLFVFGVYLLHPELGMIVTVGLVVLLAIGVTNELLTRRPVRRAAEVFGELDRLAHSVARNSEALRVMGMAPGFTDRWGRLQAEGMGAQVAASERAAAVSAIAKGWRLLLQVATLGWGAWLAIHQEITAGVIIAASIIGSRALAPAETLVGNWRNVLAARRAHDQLNRALAGEQDVEDRGADAARLRMPEVRGALEVEDLAVAYGEAGRRVLDGITLRLDPGEVLGVTGPSGSGKSTLVRALVGLVPPRAGVVRVDGFELGSWDRQQLATRTGYLPQTVQLFEGRIDANIARFGEVDDAAVVEAAKLAGAHEVIASLPDGYNTVLDGNGAPLSGGQLQRVALARAAYGRPALLVLDEPTSNLDGMGEGAFRQFLGHARAWGATVVIVAHRPNILVATDRMLVLGEGRVKELGPTPEVLQRIVRRVEPATTHTAEAAGGDGKAASTADSARGADAVAARQKADASAAEAPGDGAPAGNSIERMMRRPGPR